jgi:hypothetical protein
VVARGGPGRRARRQVASRAVNGTKAAGQRGPVPAGQDPGGLTFTHLPPATRDMVAHLATTTFVGRRWPAGERGAAWNGVLPSRQCRDWCDARSGASARVGSSRRRMGHLTHLRLVIVHLPRRAASCLTYTESLNTTHALLPAVGESSSSRHDHGVRRCPRSPHTVLFKPF